MEASTKYLRLLTSDVPAEEDERVREALLAYCKRDTEAMVLVYRALLAASGG